MNNQANIQWPKEIQEQDQALQGSTSLWHKLIITLAADVQVCSYFILFRLLCARLLGFTKWVRWPDLHKGNNASINPSHFKHELHFSDVQARLIMTDAI